MPPPPPLPRLLTCQSVRQGLWVHVPLLLLGVL
jgi:hypothetical protein